MWPRIPDRVLASTPLVRAWVAKVCPYGIITTNRKSPVESRVFGYVVKDKLCASVLDDCFRLCCWATKRAPSDRPLALSIQYGMLCDRVRFSLDLSALQRR